jgi:hypothetical protein
MNDRELTIKLQLTAPDDNSVAVQKTVAAAKEAARAAQQQTAAVRRLAQETARLASQQVAAARQGQQAATQQHAAQRQTLGSQQQLTQSSRRALTAVSQLTTGVTQLARSYVLLTVSKEDNLKVALQTIARFEAIAQAIRGTITVLQQSTTLWRELNRVMNAGATASGAASIVSAIGGGVAGGAAGMAGSAGQVAARGAAAGAGRDILATVAGTAAGTAATTAMTQRLFPFARPPVYTPTTQTFFPFAAPVVRQPGSIGRLAPGAAAGTFASGFRRSMSAGNRLFNSVATAVGVNQAMNWAGGMGRRALFGTRNLPAGAGWRAAMGRNLFGGGLRQTLGRIGGFAFRGLPTWAIMYGLYGVAQTANDMRLGRLGDEGTWSGGTARFASGVGNWITGYDPDASAEKYNRMQMASLRQRMSTYAMDMRTAQYRAGLNQTGGFFGKAREFTAAQRGLAEARAGIPIARQHLAMLESRTSGGMSQSLSAQTRLAYTDQQINTLQELIQLEEKRASSLKQLAIDEIAAAQKRRDLAAEELSKLERQRATAVSEAVAWNRLDPWEKQTALAAAGRAAKGLQLTREERDLLRPFERVRSQIEQDEVREAFRTGGGALIAGLEGGLQKFLADAGKIKQLKLQVEEQAEIIVKLDENLPQRLADVEAQMRPIMADLFMRLRKTFVTQDMLRRAIEEGNVRLGQ